MWKFGRIPYKGGGMEIGKVKVGARWMGIPQTLSSL